MALIVGLDYVQSIAFSGPIIDNNYIALIISFYDAVTGICGILADRLRDCPRRRIIGICGKGVCIKNAVALLRISPKYHMKYSIRRKEYIKDISIPSSR